jgi:hypothetical protein
VGEPCGRSNQLITYFIFSPLSVWSITIVNTRTTTNPLQLPTPGVRSRKNALRATQIARVVNYDPPRRWAKRMHRVFQQNLSEAVVHSASANDN